MNEVKSWCYTIPESQDPAKYGGYVPSVVTRGKSGHAPMTGRGEFSMPWVWGSTIEEARSICAEQNERIGITPEDEMQIVLSSFRFDDEEVSDD